MTVICPACDSMSVRHHAADPGTAFEAPSPEQYECLACGHWWEPDHWSARVDLAYEASKS